MTQCRDWLATLWRASFKGVSFWVERDAEIPGRRIAVHRFPMRDTPYLEDMGEDVRRFSVTAYVASDTADTEATALVAAIAAKGAGTLVLPTHGPLTVRALPGRRDRSKDSHGYIAFELEFIREGAATGLITAGLAASLVFAAVSTLASVAASAFGRANVSGQPDRVASGAAATLQEAAATLEAVRTTYPVTSDASATARAAIETLHDDAATLVSRSTGADGAAATQLYEIASTLVGGMEAEDALAAVTDIVEFGLDSETATGTATDLAQAAAEAEAARAMRLAVLAAYGEALMAATFADRPSGISARALAAERFGAEMARCIGGLDAELYVALAELRGLVCDYLTRLITDLAPVAQVEAPRMLSSIWWAWRLYGDPTRADEIVARNRLPHPSFVPRTFEALVS